VKRKRSQIEDVDFATFLVSKEPVYRKEDLSDIRPTGGFIPYYSTDPIEQAAYDYFSSLVPRCIQVAEPKPIEFAVCESKEHTFERFKALFPPVTLT